MSNASCLTLIIGVFLAENAGRLVHVVGEAQPTAPVEDAQFGVSINALKLKRRVEMYQWVEHTSKVCQMIFTINNNKIINIYIKLKILKFIYKIKNNAITKSDLLLKM